MAWDLEDADFAFPPGLCGPLPAFFQPRISLGRLTESGGSTAFHPQDAALFVSMAFRRLLRIRSPAPFLYAYLNLLRRARDFLVTSPLTAPPRHVVKNGLF